MGPPDLQLGIHLGCIQRADAGQALHCISELVRGLPLELGRLDACRKREGSLLWLLLLLLLLCLGLRLLSQLLQELLLLLI